MGAHARRGWLCLVCLAGHCPSGAVADPALERVQTVAPRDGWQPIEARVDGTGTVHVLYDADNGPWYVRSTDGARSFGDPQPVVGPAARRPRLEFRVSDMAIGPHGQVHVALYTNAWRLKLPKPEWGCFYTRLDSAQTSFTPPRNVNQRPSEGFSLAADETGRVTLCWLADKLYANVSRDQGDTFAPAVELDPAFDPCNCCTTSAAYGADERLAVLYREETNNERDMYLVLWDQSRQLHERRRISDAPWPIDACPMTYYKIARRGAGYSAVWPTKGSVYWARLDAQGKPLPPGEIKTPGSSGRRTGLLVLEGPDGSTLVAWKHDDRLGWQLYDAAGQPVDVAGSATSPGPGAAGVVDRSGRFVLFR